MALVERTQEGARAIEDRFTRIDDDVPAPEGGGVIVSLTRFEAEKDALLARDGELGVWLEAGESPTALSAALDRLALVALDFPVFNDGRAFSSARLLRERYGFKGEVRAIGDVLLEQLAFMLRSGFSTFEIEDPQAIADFAQVVGEVRVVYQPTGDGKPTALQRRLGRS